MLGFIGLDFADRADRKAFGGDDGFGELAGRRERIDFRRPRALRSQPDPPRKPWRPTWLSPCRAGPRRFVERLRPIDDVFLVRLLGAANALPSILSNMTRAASVKVASISRTKTTRGQPARRIEPRQMLSAQHGGFPGDCRISRSVNPLLPIRADAEISDRLNAFDNPGKVSLAWRFRPFAHPRERRSFLIVFRRRSGLPVLRSSFVPTPRQGSCAPVSGRERERPTRCAPLSPQVIRCRALADGQSGRRQLRRPCRSRSLRPKPLWR